MISISIPERPNCTRIKPCKICPFINSDFNRNESDQDDYHRSAMLELANGNDGVWTCLLHLNYDKSLRAQCHIGAKELVKASAYLQDAPGLTMTDDWNFFDQEEGIKLKTNKENL